MGLGMGLNFLLLLAMVATNILSLYHLSSTSSFHGNAATPPPLPVPDHLLRQLATIRATISHLTGLRTTSTSTHRPSSAADLLLYASLSPIASACHDHPDLLHRYMSYTPFQPCPSDLENLAEKLALRGCHPLPRRRCFSPSPSSKPLMFSADPFPSALPDAAVLWPPSAGCRSFSCLPPHLGFDMAVEAGRFLPPTRSTLDLTVPQFLRIARNLSSPIRLALDVGGGSGTFAARMKADAGATVVTTTMDLGAPYSEATAIRGLVPLHVPLQQRFPVHDGALDLVRCGHAVNRWIPAAAMEFLLYDADRVLRAGGFLLMDHFFCRAPDLDGVYAPMIGKLGYRILKWAVGNKTDSGGVKNGEVYLTALLQKPAGR